MAALIWRNWTRCHSSGCHRPSRFALKGSWRVNRWEGATCFCSTCYHFFRCWVMPMWQRPWTWRIVLLSGRNCCFGEFGSPCDPCLTPWSRNAESQGAAIGNVYSIFMQVDQNQVRWPSGRSSWGGVLGGVRWQWLLGFAIFWIWQHAYILARWKFIPIERKELFPAAFFQCIYSHRNILFPVFAFLLSVCRQTPKQCPDDPFSSGLSILIVQKVVQKD